MLQHARGVGKKDVPDAEVMTMVRSWLAGGESFASTDEDFIVDAVLKHSGFNNSEDHPVLVTLMDADRIICSMAEEVMHATRFWLELPDLDPVHLSHDPEAHSYRNPRSVFKNFECRRDWIDPSSRVCVRLPRAMELMKRFVGAMNDYIEEVEGQRIELGLYPDYPKFS
ncbi:MAG: hypothetical protein AAB691_05065 [Patescibacteria group bacterium]